MDKVTLFVGKNAQGKSNILESIYFLATSKSPRAERDVQLIKKDEGYCIVEGEVEEGGERTKIEVTMQRIVNGVEENGLVEKRTKVNGISRRVLDYIGNLSVVFFSPEDINLVTGAPSLRRWYLDITLAQTDRSYKKAISVYCTALTSRNRVLKRIREGLSRIDELDFWTDQLIESGGVVSSKRQEFFEYVKSYLAEKDWSEFSYSYIPSDITAQRIKEYQSRELASGNTLIGPHRDDFIFLLKDQNLASFGSRGEQRTAVLKFKMGELGFVKKVKQSTPVLVLDDIFSELDLSHRQLVSELIFDQQTIFSALETENLPEGLQKVVKVVRVEGGETV